MPTGTPPPERLGAEPLNVASMHNFLPDFKDFFKVLYAYLSLLSPPFLLVERAAFRLLIECFNNLLARILPKKLLLKNSVLVHTMPS